MTIIKVKVPNNFANKKEIDYEDIINYEDDSQWESIQVNEKAGVVLDYLKSIK